MAGERTLPGLGLTGFWDAGSDGWKAGMDTNLRTLSATAQLSVKSRVTTLPGSPTNGDIYIVPSGGDAGKVAIRDNGAWVNLTPLEGWRAWVQDEDMFVTWTGAAWIADALLGSAVYDPASLADGAAVSTTVTVTGAALGDFVDAVSFSLDLQGVDLTGYVSAADTVTVKFRNTTGGTIDLASGTVRVRVREV